MGMSETWHLTVVAMGLNLGACNGGGDGGPGAGGGNGGDLITGACNG